MKKLPALKVLLPYMLGLLAAKYLVCSFSILQIIFFLTLLTFPLLVFLHRLESNKFLLLSACCFLFLGFVQYQISSGFFPAGHISHFTNINKSLTLQGMVAAYPESRSKKTRLLVEVDSLFSRNRSYKIAGKVLVIIPKNSTILEYGDRIQFSGKLSAPRGKRNPGEFDYREYLAAQNIFATISIGNLKHVARLSSGHGNWLLRSVVFPTKSYLDKFISDNLPPNEAALLKGLLIGERGEISANLKENFSKLGVIHILAVSGLHVGFIILAFMTLAGVLRFPYRIRVVLVILVLIFYAFLTNLKPSVLRAATMGGFILLGSALERKTDFYNSLTLAGLVILFFRPLDLFQPGFQLSFSAVLSIVYLYPKLQTVFPLKQIYTELPDFAPVRYALDLFVVSLAAFIGTLPLTALYFNRLPNLSLLANLFVVPLSFVGLGCAMAGALINLLSTGVADFYLASTWLSLNWMLRLVEFGSTIPYSFFEIYWFDPLLSFLYFSLIIMLFELKTPKVRRWCIYTSLIFSNVWIWQENHFFHRELEVTMIDVGQGDAILLRFPDGRCALIDGGKRSPSFDNGKRVIAPYLRHLGIRQIDALILSHADSDHLGGFPSIMRQFKINEVWDNGQEKGTALYHEYHHLLDSLDVRHRILKTGDVINKFTPVMLYVVHPTTDFAINKKHSANDASLSLKLSYGRIDFLFLGDVERSGELLVNNFDYLLQSEVLKVSHHGSRTSSTSALMTNVSPELAIISVGERNKFGHPAAEVLERLTGLGAKIFRTDRECAIMLRTDGEKIKSVEWQ